MHAQDIAVVLEKLTKWCEEEGVPMAVLGAIAMWQHGYVRHTEDIDILTTKEGLDKIHEKLVGLGFLPRARGLRKRLIETEHHVNVDVITVGEHAGADKGPVAYPHPNSDDFTVLNGVRVPKLEKLIEFKLASGIWGNRMHDLGDVARLISINKLDEKIADRLHPAVRAKYLELLDQSRKEKELE